MKLFLLVFFVFLPVSSLAAIDDTSLSDEIEDLSWMSVLINCEFAEEASVHVSVDIVTDILGVSSYPPSVIRHCMRQKLEEVYSRISNDRRRLIESDASPDDLETAMFRLDSMQFKLNQRLYNMAMEADDRLQGVKAKTERSNITLTELAFLRWQEEELEAFIDVLGIEQYQQM